MHLPSEGVVLAKLAGASAVLSSCSLAQNAVGNEGAKAFGRAIERNTTLTSLDLRSNRISADGAKALAAGLAANKHLATLDVSANLLGLEGAAAFADVLSGPSGNLTLKQLAIDGGADLPVQKLKGYDPTRSIDLSGSSIGIRLTQLSAIVIGELIKNNLHLTALDLSSHTDSCGHGGIGHGGAAAIADGLRANNAITMADLSGNRLDADAMDNLYAEIMVCIVSRRGRLITAGTFRVGTMRWPGRSSPSRARRRSPSSTLGEAPRPPPRAHREKPLSSARCGSCERALQQAGIVMSEATVSASDICGPEVARGDCSWWCVQCGYGFDGFFERGVWHVGLPVCTCTRVVLY
jgi:hypothetical protein